MPVDVRGKGMKMLHDPALSVAASHPWACEVVAVVLVLVVVVAVVAVAVEETGVVLIAALVVVKSPMHAERMHALT
jgi:hypothetical protein